MQATEEGVKKALNEYARISAVEIFEQISVNYSGQVISAVKAGITKRSYQSAKELAEILQPKIGTADPSQLLQDLFEAGVIGNRDSAHGSKRFFWSYREEEELDWEMGVTVHPGLLNYFNIRHR